MGWRRRNCLRYYPVRKLGSERLVIVRDGDVKRRRQRYNPNSGWSGTEDLVSWKGRLLPKMITPAWKSGFII